MENYLFPPFKRKKLILNGHADISHGLEPQPLGGIGATLAPLALILLSGHLNCAISA
jgi:hypothetical protein